MRPDLAVYVGWSLAMSLVALGYGEYASARQAKGQPITVKERVRNYLILYAIAVGLTASPSLLTGWRFGFAFVSNDLRVIATFALSPLFIWCLFDVPLRFARQWSRNHRPTVTGPHPLDGAWPQAASFLDQITAARGSLQAKGVAESSSRKGLTAMIEPEHGHHRSPALDRVARLQAVDPPPSRPS